MPSRYHWGGDTIRKISFFHSWDCMCMLSQLGLHVHAQSLSCVLCFVTPQIVACHAPLSMGFSRQEYWSGLLFPPPGGLSNPGIEPVSSVFLVVAGRFFTTEPPGKPLLGIAMLC